MTGNTGPDPSCNASVTLVAEGESIVCSRKALTTASRYFQAMFNSNMKESQASEIVLQDVLIEPLRQLLCFAETGSLSPSMDNAVDILITACMLGFENAIHHCKDYVLNHVAAANCLGIKHVAEAHGLNQLFHKARKYAFYYFAEATFTNDFYQLPLPAVVDFLKDPRLNVSSEVPVLLAAARWIAQDQQTRVEQLHSLLPCVHLASLTPEEKIHVLGDPTIQSIPEMLDALGKSTTENAMVGYMGYDELRVHKVISCNICNMRSFIQVISVIFHARLT